MDAPTFHRGIEVFASQIAKELLEARIDGAESDTACPCSEYKNGCTFRLDYATYGNNLTDEELGTVLSKLKSI